MSFSNSGRAVYQRPTEMMAVFASGRFVWDRRPVSRLYQAPPKGRHARSNAVWGRFRNSAAMIGAADAVTMPPVMPRTWCPDRHGFGQCLGVVGVEARENPSRLAAMSSFKPHKEAGYTSAAMTLGTDFAKPACNRARSIYVRTWTRPGARLVGDPKRLGEGPLAIYPLGLAVESCPRGHFPDLFEVELVAALCPDRLACAESDRKAGTANFHAV